MGPSSVGSAIYAAGAVVDEAADGLLAHRRTQLELVPALRDGDREADAAVEAGEGGPAAHGAGSEVTPSRSPSRRSSSACR